MIIGLLEDERKKIFGMKMIKLIEIFLRNNSLYFTKNLRKND